MKIRFIGAGAALLIVVLGIAELVLLSKLTDAGGKAHVWEYFLALLLTGSGLFSFSYWIWRIVKTTGKGD